MAAQVEAGAAKDELKRLRKEMLRLKNEWSSLRALYESAKVQSNFCKRTALTCSCDWDRPQPWRFSCLMSALPANRSRVLLDARATRKNIIVCSAG